MFDDLRSSVSQLSPSLLDISVVTVVEFYRPILVGIYIAMNMLKGLFCFSSEAFSAKCTIWAIE